MRPGERPAARLDELLEVSRGAEANTTPAEAIAALLAGRALGSSVLRGQPRCVVVFTLRADFFGAFMESSLWTDRRGRISRVEVGPLRGEALCEAIVRPARDLGVDVEPALIERLLADAGSKPRVLPLLQETLASSPPPTRATRASMRPAIGRHRVFVSALWETMRIRRCSLDDFKARLVAAHRAQLLSLARADLVAAMPAAVVTASQIEPDRGVQFHFVIDPQARDAWA
jgi:hypothetical protein